MAKAVRAEVRVGSDSDELGETSEEDAWRQFGAPALQTLKAERTVTAPTANTTAVYSDNRRGGVAGRVDAALAKFGIGCTSERGPWRSWTLPDYQW